MPYPYGMYNAPTIGNGLGGLPRKAPSVPTIPSPRYNLQQVANFTTTSMPNSGLSVSFPILMNGKGLQYFTNNSGPLLYRNQFDYSAEGVTNQTSTFVASTSSISQLPTAPSGENAARNCVWSHQVSSTQMLFKYTNLRPFLVTWDGVTDSSYIFPPDPSGISVSNTSDAFILPNGNLAVFGQDNSSGGTIYLIEYTPSLTFVRSFNIANSGALSGYRAAVRRTSYGYIVGIMSTAANNAPCAAVTLNSNCTTVIASRTATLQLTTAAASTFQSIICGQEGVIFASVGGLLFGSINMPVSSTGAIATITTTQYYVGEGLPSGSNFIPNTFIGTMPTGMGCDKFATTTAPSFFVNSNSGTSTNKGLTFTSRGNASSGGIQAYIDIDVTPIINTNPIQGATIIYPAHTNTIAKATYFYQIDGPSGVNMATDANGFVWLNYAGSSQSNNMFRRV